jgi:hypothetical protein
MNRQRPAAGFPTLSPEHPISQVLPAPTILIALTSLSLPASPPAGQIYAST